LAPEIGLTGPKNHNDFTERGIHNKLEPQLFPNTCAVQKGAYAARALERAKGIEPSYAAWEAAVLPLNYARKFLLVLSNLSFARSTWHGFGTALAVFVGWYSTGTGGNFKPFSPSSSSVVRSACESGNAPTKLPRLSYRLYRHENK
jgi:hypothetical protein